MKSSRFSSRGVYFNIKYIAALEIDLVGSFFLMGRFLKIRMTKEMLKTDLSEDS